MTPVRGAGGAAAVRFGGASPTPTAGGEAPQLLPDPGTMGTQELNDAMSMLYALLAKDRDVGMTKGKTGIENKRREREEAIEHEKEALEREKEAAGDDSPGFWDCLVDTVAHLVENLVTCDVEGVFSDFADDLRTAWNSKNFWGDLESVAMVVAKVAAAVGAVALTAATCGAAGPAAAVLVVALALSCGGMVVSETKCLDGIFGEGSSKWIGLGMSAAGTLLSMGAGASMAAGQAANASSSVLGVSTRTWASLATTANIVKGSAEVVQGGAHVKVKHFEADAQEARADATVQRQKMERLTRMVEWLLTELKDLAKSKERAMQVVQGAIEINNQTMLAASSFARS
jgi:hypothetical protein